MVTIKASAPGNIFFFGEHAVVYGRPGIVAAVDRRTYTTLKSRQDDKIVVSSDTFGRASARISKSGLANLFVEKKELLPVANFVNRLIVKFKLTKGFNLKISSQIPPNSGMSSSSAVLCSILKAVSTFADQNVKKEDYFDFVFPFQVQIHGGRASGSEIVSSTFGGINKIRKTKREKARIISDFLGTHDFTIVLGDTKVSSPTSLTVGYHIPSLIRRNPHFVWGTFNKIAMLCKRAEKAIVSDNTKQLGQLMNRNQILLSSLGLSHPKLDDCVREAIKAGALGAKLSGSGWGGIMFALTTPKKQNKIVAAIARTGANVIKTKIGVEGVRLEK